MISLVGKNLTAGYGGVDIIKNINLSVKEGEIAVGTKVEIVDAEGIHVTVVPIKGDE